MAIGRGVGTGVGFGVGRGVGLSGTGVGPAGRGVGVAPTPVFEPGLDGAGDPYGLPGGIVANVPFRQTDRAYGQATAEFHAACACHDDLGRAAANVDDDGCSLGLAGKRPFGGQEG